MESETLAAKKHSVDFVEIVDGNDEVSGEGENFCYTKALLKSVLQLMGCKTRVAHKVAQTLQSNMPDASVVNMAIVANNKQAFHISICAKFGSLLEVTRNE
jgi:hypothetical protein